MTNQILNQMNLKRILFYDHMNDYIVYDVKHLKMKEI